ncbi:zinc finger, CCHC-type containing protein, partial [Tanacetum coccineum]
MITLYELWTKKKPNLNYLRVWGCREVVRLPDPKLKTLGEIGIKCIFVGYVEHSKAFRFYVIEPNDSVVINSIIESRDATFDENRFSSVSRPSQRSLVNRTEHIGGLVVPEKVIDGVVQQPEPELKKSKRHRTPKDFGPEFQLYLIEGTRDDVSDQHSYCFNIEDDPKTFDEAMKYQDVAFWKKQLMMIWNPSWATTLGLIIHQIDVKTTFLNGELDEEQAPKQCHQKFDEVVLSNGYLLNQADKCVYSKFDESGKGFIICLYIDDMLIFGTDQVQVDLTKEFLSSRFSMKDIGEADVILGIRIIHESNGIAISQSHYIEKVLKKFNYFNCTPVSTLMDTNEKLMPNNGQAVSQLEYSRLIGCLMYVITCTRPDIAFIMGKLSRYTSNPGTQHWQAIQLVLKYLKKTIDYRLMYTGYPSVLEGCTDASWINNTEDNSSTSATASKEAKWLKNLLFKIPFLSKPIAHISIRCDSAATLAKAYSQMYNGKSIHLGVRHSMIRELITNGVVSIEFV